MPEPSPVPPRRLGLAVAVGAALVLGAPFIGGLRAAVREAFPGQYVLIVAGGIALAIGGALALAVARIRERRAIRYGALGLAVALGVAYALAFSSGDAEQDAVERFHFVEYGVVALLFYRAWKDAADSSILILPALAGLLVGTLEEWFQWFVPVRVGEVKDIFLNLAAIACGLLFSIALDPPPRFSAALRPGSARRVGLLASVVVLAFGGFFHALHLGHDVHDGDIGTFESRYTPARLFELSAERTARWRTDPPLAWRRLSREDQYMSEALAHVQERNRMWAQGNIPAAWAENRILEKYYAPVLDTPSYVSKTGHRWPAAQREDAGRRTAGARTLDYVSAAYPYDLHQWSPLYYWLVVGALAAACALPAFAGAPRRPPRTP
jgi:hypothetical protein